MPVTFEIDSARHTVRAVASGIVTYADIARHLTEEEQDDALGLAEVIDGLRRVAATDRAVGFAWVAFEPPRHGRCVRARNAAGRGCTSEFTRECLPRPISTIEPKLLRCLNG